MDELEQTNNIDKGVDTQDGNATIEEVGNSNDANATVASIDGVSDTVEDALSSDDLSTDEFSMDDFDEIDMTALKGSAFNVKGVTAWGTIIAEEERPSDDIITDYEEEETSPDITKLAVTTLEAESVVPVGEAYTLEDYDDLPTFAQKVRHGIWSVFKFILLLPYRLVKATLRASYVILNIVTFLCIVACIGGVVLYAKFQPMYEQVCAEAYDKLAHLDEGDFHKLSNTVVYDKEGEKIGEIDAGDYIYKNITEVNDFVQYGYIAVEDRRFREHLGVDMKSIIRAAWAVIRHNGDTVQGGSTITQQVIKNCVIQSQEKSYTRKLLEVVIAPRIEQRFSKDKIMEFYVNTCFYGNRCYGIETASQYYFGKTNTKLTLAEAAMLCGVSNSPNNYNPVASMELANERKMKVLNSMLECEFITQDEYQKAVKQKIKLHIPDEKKSHENYMVSYALHCTVMELMKKDGFAFQYVFKDRKEEKKYRKRYSELYSSMSATVRAGGYKIYTSFNRKLQEKLQKSIDSNLSVFKEKQRSNKKYALQGASVCIDNSTGLVVAMVGGRGTKDEFNRAFLSSRQPGSTIKPLLDYTPAINEGYINPSTLIDDHEMYDSKGEIFPKNSGGHYYGNVTIREGLARSLNTVAYQVYQRTGVDLSMSYLDKMHFSSLSYADRYAPSLSLGGFTYGAKVVEMARGYATIAMQGQYTTRTCLIKVNHDIDGEIYNYGKLSDTQSQVYTADSAFMITDALQGGIEEKYGTAHSIQDEDMIVAGKTGTTSSNRDAWFCGYTKYYTTAVWIGYDTPRVMEGMYGGTVPAKIFKDYMSKIKKNKSKADFTIPTTIGLRRIQGGDYTGEVYVVDANGKVVKKTDADSKTETEIKEENEKKEQTEMKDDKKNSKGKKGKKVKETEKETEPERKRSYYIRKKGWEWYSIQNKEIYEQTQKDYNLEMEIKTAQQALDDFKSFFITSAADCLEIDSRFKACMDLILAVSSEYEQTKMKKEAADHYENLNGEIREKWEDAIEEYQQAEQVRAQAEYDSNVEQQMDLANQNLKNDRIRIAEWYLTQLSSRVYYSKATQRLLADALTYIERLKPYKQYYKDFIKRYEEAKAICEKLPLPPERPDEPRDETDTQPDDTTYEEPEYADEDV